MSEQPSTIVELADTVSELMYEIVGWILLFIGLIGLLRSFTMLFDATGVPDLVGAFTVLALTFVCLSAGVFVNPRLRRWLNRRHSVSTFGRAQTVDSRVFGAEERRTETCVRCESRVSTGLLRRFREEYAVAGIPIWTLSENQNCYCRSCGLEEISPSPSGDAEPSIEEFVTEAE
ncbi:hypothetical protein C440_06652 [Haloferax mucosum ATCC BAA-1512]|uniref:DUF8108 domain-containing protein n=1 Tax=Haloferax mucosum ATCC BAA-1512 TaxID=662479 RepID=M0IKG2_9EURY|nr:hypothetical protein [Haloferax mucosum]ELZ95949.1 hypothetical protein C440_06652 [Haloferax mucosum ATCC BAA-1512]